MKHTYFVLLAMVSLMALVSCTQAEISVIPQPVSVVEQSGTFELTPKTTIVVDKKTEELGYQLMNMLAPATGYLPTVQQKKAKSNCIVLSLNSKLKDLGTEGYKLTVTSKKVLIEAPEKAGVFYGMQTLRQLLPVEIYRQATVKGVEWKIPCVTIEDTPRFQWRGMHLDVARHYMPKEFVKKFIDLLAMHKMNSFHWHLTEDQGWRIEIKKYPKLTEVGAWRKETVIGKNTGKYDGKPHGGFYTQDDVREIVEYARQRYINVVPEIEMPGHSQAAIAAYPELGNTDKKLEVFTKWGVNPNVYNVDDSTIAFLQDVLTEVLELFPSEFIHIGGDECPKTQWKNSPKAQAKIKALGIKDEHELQSWFIKQMDTFLDKRGRRLIGWDEILEGGLAPGATVMSWRGEKGGITAAKAGHDVVMAPNSHTYFDHYQANPKNEPFAIGGFLPLQKVYSYNPIPKALNAEEAKRVLGAQAQLWSEYIPNAKHCEYMAYPRTCALAETVWTPLEKKDYDLFRERLETHLQRLEILDVNFRKLDKAQPVIGRWKSGQTDESFKPLQWDITKAVKEAGTYQVMFQYTGGEHRLDIKSVELLANDKVIAEDAHPGVTGGSTKDNVYTVSVDKLDKNARYTIRAVVRSDGGADSNGDVFLAKQ